MDIQTLISKNKSLVLRQLKNDLKSSFIFVKDFSIEKIVSNNTKRVIFLITEKDGSTTRTGYNYDELKSIIILNNREKAFKKLL